MLESLRQKVLELRAKVDEYERLGARLEELERTVSAEIPRLWQLRDHLAKQHREVAGRAAQLGHAGAAGGREAGKRTDAAPAALERMRHQGLLASLESAQQEVSGLLDRLAKLQAPGAASPAVGEEKLLVLEPEEGGAAAAPAAEAPAAEAEAAAPESAPVPAAPPHAETAAEAGPAAEPADATAEGIEPPHHEAARLEDQQQALRDAAETGRQAMESLDRFRQLLQEIARGGMWHAMTSAVLPKSPDHARIDQALAAAHEAQEELHRFHQQLAALRQRFGSTLQVGDVPSLADLALGALGAPAQGESGPRHALQRIHQAYHEVRGLCSRLQLDANRIRVRILTAERRGARTINRA